MNHNLLIEEINRIAKEKEIDPQTVANMLEMSIKKAYVKNRYEENLEMHIDPTTGLWEANLLFLVVDQEFADSEEFDNILQISENDPEVVAAGLKVGDYFKRSFDLSNEFTPLQVQQILQSFKQKIIEITNKKVCNSWRDKIGQVIVAKIDNEDPKTGALYVNLDFPDLIKTMGFVSQKETNKLEKLEVDRKYPFVVKDVIEATRFWPVILSRADARLVTYYLTTCVPEIEDGLIEIKRIARIAGIKTKVAVVSKNPTIREPSAICVGKHGMRIKEISEAVGGEKIEVFNYDDDPVVLITNLFSRAKIDGVKLFYKADGTTVARAIVVGKSEYISSLIGNKGCNIKLNNQILGFNVEVIDQQQLPAEMNDYMRVWSPEFEEHFKPKPKPKVTRSTVVKPLVEEHEEAGDANADLELYEGAFEDLLKELNHSEEF